MPQIIKVDVDDGESLGDACDQITRELARGGVIAFPTDTFYGLGADPFNAHAIQSLFQIKGRSRDKAILVLIESIASIRQLASGIPPTAEKLMARFWPGPLTLLFPADRKISPQLTADTGKIGLRQPGSRLTRKLLNTIGMPLTASSANLSGSHNPVNAREVLETLGNRVNIIVDGGECPGGLESTVLDPTVDPPVIIREGAVSRKDIESALNLRCATIS